MKLTAAEKVMSARLIDEKGFVGGEIVISYASDCFDCENAWMTDYIEIAGADDDGKLAGMLFDWAERFALDRDCILIPSPDMSWEAFHIWKRIDPFSLLTTLDHAGAPEYVRNEGGDINRFKTQLRKIRDDPNV